MVLDLNENLATVDRHNAKVRHAQVVVEDVQISGVFLFDHRAATERSNNMREHGLRSQPVDEGVSTSCRLECLSNRAEEVGAIRLVSHAGTVSAGEFIEHAQEIELRSIAPDSLHIDPSCGRRLVMHQGA
jgi:hypothetical protein